MHISTMNQCDNCYKEKDGDFSVTRPSKENTKMMLAQKTCGKVNQDNKIRHQSITFTHGD